MSILTLRPVEVSNITGEVGNPGEVVLETEDYTVLPDENREDIGSEFRTGKYVPNFIVTSNWHIIKAKINVPVDTYHADFFNQKYRELGGYLQVAYEHKGELFTTLCTLESMSAEPPGVVYSSHTLTFKTLPHKPAHELPVVDYSALLCA